MPITLEQVSHVYQPGTPYEWRALDNVSLTIPEGEFWGVIGPTGSGKSTLIQHMNGLLKPTSGRVLVDDIDLGQRGVNLKAVRQKVGLVFQYPEQQLFGETIFEDIAFGPRNLGLLAGEVEARVARAMERVGLDPSFRGRTPFGLSGGQARRVALAGVLAMEPRVLILDEPTAGLDPRGREEILALVKTFPGLGMSVVLVSHSMDDVAEQADQVLVMHRGRVHMIGTPAELFSRRAELEAIGLGVPAAAQLVDMLRERGWNLSATAVTLDEAVAGIAAALGKGGGRR
ncbi:MAG: ABC-type cobalt transport system ATPase component [Symbiobacteriaceae bacterium]|jgi:energy-coupling factor transport system ATP-binding protein|nr:ABC-type cobalt transport system ATPase component [Symbiobacteriaceae bacterium]